MKVRMQALGLAALFGVAVAFSGATAQPPAAKPGAQPNDKDSTKGTQPRFDAARFLKDHDKNKDGKLSKDELPSAATKDFDKIDTNKDGAITPDELQKHAETMASQRPQLLEIVWYAVDLAPEPLTTQEVQEAYEQLRKIDKNNDGKIDESELKACRTQRKKERIDDIFTTLDKNKDGKLGKDEVRGLWTDNFASLDKNKDGMLDRQEVEAACSMSGNEKPDTPNTKPGK